MQTVVQLNAPAGTPVFKLQARDPDTDHNIHYMLVRDRSEFWFHFLWFEWQFWCLLVWWEDRRENLVHLAMLLVCVAAWFMEF